MRGSERLLYIGNFNCLCAGINENESLWQMKRILVTDVHIYFFPYTNYMIKTPKLNEDWNNFKELPQNIPQFQERTQYLKNGKLDSDSITSPPLLVQQVSDKYVSLVPIDQLAQHLINNGYNVAIKSMEGKAICLINKFSKEIQYMIAQNQNDNLRFFKAISVGNAFQKYLTFRQSNNIQFNQQIASWLQNSVNENLVLLEVNNDQIISSYKLLCECQNLVNGIIFKLSLNQHIKTLLLLMQTLKSDLLINLTLKSCNLKNDHITEITQILQNCSFLEAIDLSQNQINEKGIDQLSKIFENCQFINSLNLSQNKISCKDYYFDIFLLKACTMLYKLSLDLSYNNLNDSCITSIECRILNEDFCTLQLLNVSYNNFTSNGSMQLMILFQSKFEKKTTLKIYPLPFSFETINQQLKEIRSEKSGLLYEDQFNQQASSLRRGPSLLKQSIVLHHQSLQHISPDNLEKGQSIFLNQQSEVQENIILQLQLIKRPSNKISPSTKIQLQEVRQKEQQLKLFLNQKCFSIEDLYQITEEIKNFQFSLSIKLIKQLNKLIEQFLIQALFCRDNYSISFLTFASFNMDIDITIFKEKYSRLAKRLQLIEDRINRLLNFQVEESKMNKELDDLIVICHRLDIRGQPVDYLIQLKLEREQKIKQLIYSDYSWQKEYYQDLSIDYSQYIFRDKEYIIFDVNDQMDVNFNLVLHPQSINYFQLCEKSIEGYYKEYEQLQKIQKYQEIYFDKELINEESLKNYNEKITNRILHFTKTGIRRAKFILHNHFEDFNLDVWNENIEEFQLNNARLLVNYYCSNYVNQQIRMKLENQYPNYQDLTFDEILQDIDQKQLNIQMRQFISQIKMKHIEVNFNIEFQIEFINTIKIENYPFITQQQFIQINDSIYQLAQKTLKKNLQNIFYQLTLIGSEEFDINIILQSSRAIIDICINSPCVCLFGDELYWLMYKYNIENSKADLSNLFHLFLFFISPSQIMIGPLYNWLKEKYFNITFDIQFKIWIKNQTPIYWVPCLQQVNYHLFNAKVVVNLYHSKVIQILIGIEKSVQDVMNEIDSYINQEDKSTFWIYLRIEDQTNQKDYPIYVDVPLISELNFWENVSKINQTFSYVLVKRRIFCYNALEFYSHSELLDQFISFPHICFHYDQETVEKMIILFMCIESINDQEQNIMDINIYNYIQFIPIYLRQLIDVESIIFKYSDLIGQLTYFDQKQLLQLIKIIFSFNPSINSTIFDITKENQNYQLIVNYHGIHYYIGPNHIQTILYQQIVGISVSCTQMRIHFYIQELFKHVISFNNLQVLECYQNILSYMSIRLKENIGLLSNYVEFSKYKYKYQLDLISHKNQNELVNSLIELSITKGIINALDTYQTTFASQFIENLFLKEITKKYINLNNQIKKEEFYKPNLHQFFPFQKPCPFIQFVKPKVVQCLEIQQFFGKNSKNEIKRLFDPLRELFPCAEYMDEDVSSKLKLSGSQKQEINICRNSQTLKSRDKNSDSAKQSLKSSYKLQEGISKQDQEIKSEQQSLRKYSNEESYRSQDVKSINKINDQKKIDKIMEEEENAKSECSPSLFQQQQQRISLSLSKTIDNQFQSSESDFLLRLRNEEMTKSQTQQRVVHQLKFKSQTKELFSLVHSSNDSLFNSVDSNFINQQQQQKVKSQQQIE